MNAPWLVSHVEELDDGSRAKLRRLLLEHDARYRPAAAFRPLPYSDPLGPTGALRTFGHVGGGNHTGTARPTYGPGELPAAFWDQNYAESLKRFDNTRRQQSRIKANGGKRKPAHRPRTITAEQERRVAELLASGCGIKKAARLVGIGVSAVQRIKRERVP